MYIGDCFLLIMRCIITLSKENELTKFLFSYTRHLKSPSLFLSLKKKYIYIFIYNFFAVKGGTYT